MYVLSGVPHLCKTYCRLEGDRILCGFAPQECTTCNSGVLAGSLLSGTPPLFTSNGLPTCLEFKVQILTGVELTLSELCHMMLLVVHRILKLCGTPYRICHGMCTHTHTPSAIPVLSLNRYIVFSAISQIVVYVCT